MAHNCSFPARVPSVPQAGVSVRSQLWTTYAPATSVPAVRRFHPNSPIPTNGDAQPFRPGAGTQEHRNEGPAGQVNRVNEVNEVKVNEVNRVNRVNEVAGSVSID